MLYIPFFLCAFVAEIFDGPSPPLRALRFKQPDPAPDHLLTASQRLYSRAARSDLASGIRNIDCLVSVIAGGARRENEKDWLLAETWYTYVMGWVMIAGYTLHPSRATDRPVVVQYAVAQRLRDALEGSCQGRIEKQTDGKRKEDGRRTAR